MILSHKIKPSLWTLATISFLLIVAGCSNELPTDGISNDGKSVNFILNLRQSGAANADEQIGSLRLIIINDDNASVAQNVAFNPTEVYTPANGKYVLQTILKGIRAIRYYVVANERPEWNLNAITTLAELKAFEADYYDASGNASNVRAPFLMLAQCNEAVETPSGSTISKELSLVRNVVKVTLKLKQALLSPGASETPIALQKIVIDRVPKKGFLFPDKLYEASQTYTQTVEKTLQSPDFTLSTDYSTMKDNWVVYIPEHLLADKNNYTRILLSGTRSFGAAINYEIVLGDGAQQLYRATNPVALADLTTIDLSLTRNTHFTVDATINNKEVMVDLALDPWKDGGTVDVEEGKIYYLNLSDAFLRYPHTIYIDKDKKLHIKDADGNLTPPIGHSYSCFFWTNLASSSIGIADFHSDQDPNDVNSIANSMTILRDQTAANGYDVMGKVDIAVPAADVVKGVNKSYSMRLKTDKIDRKLTFAVSDIDYIPAIIDPQIARLDDVIIDGHGTSSATSSKGKFTIEAYVPKGYRLDATATPSSRALGVTFSNITPIGNDIFAPQKHEATYASYYPRDVKLGDYNLTITLVKGATIMHQSTFTLPLTIRKK